MADRDLARRLGELSRESERLFRELEAGERRLRGLAKAVWRREEEERRRLSREVHDGLGQTLTALKIQLERLRERTGEPELAAELGESVGIATDALAQTRQLSRQLRPGVLDELGLEPALRWLARSLEEWTGFTVTLEVDIGGERLDPDLETLLFRLVQEALNNALKHSGANGARVELEGCGDLLLVRVADRGRGFDPDTAGGVEGSGLAGLRDRVRIFGGRLTIIAQPGQGAVLEARVPRQAVDGGSAEEGVP